MAATSILSGATLIDGTGRPPVENAVVAFRDGLRWWPHPLCRNGGWLAGGDATPGECWRDGHARSRGAVSAAGADRPARASDDGFRNAVAAASAARALGWDSWLGTVEAGKVADLVVCAANPLGNLRHLADRSQITIVFKDGQVVARQLARDEGAIPDELLAGGWICCGLSTRDGS